MFENFYQCQAVNTGRGQPREMFETSFVGPNNTNFESLACGREWNNEVTYVNLIQLSCKQKAEIYLIGNRSKLITTN